MTFKKTFVLAFLSAGTMIGAGVLAMPIAAGIAGFWPSMFMLVFFSLSMLFSGLVLADEVNAKKEESFNFPSLYEEHFGVTGKWLASSGYMLIFYGLLISYLAGTTKIVLSAFNISPSYKVAVLLAVFITFTFLAIASVALIKRYNTVLMLVLWGAFSLLVYMGISGIDMQRFSHVDMAYLPVAIPTIIAAFVYHSIIPSLCKASNWSPEIYKPIVLGVVMGFVMNATWLIVAIGVVPEFGTFSLNAAQLTGEPIILEMSHVLQSKKFVFVGAFFAIVAMATSYLSIGMSLRHFLEDILENSFNIYNSWLVKSIAFVPPLIVAYLFANVFLMALNIVGGIGLVLLFGILPTIIFYRKTTNLQGRLMAILLFVAFSMTLLFTLLNVLGVLQITPTTT